jgi:cytoskeletal protein CcmA (bactofilin family)
MGEITMSFEDSGDVSGSVPSIISPDLKIVGDLKCTGDIQIDGTIEGSVTGGQIVIGELAKVEGSIVAEVVRIFGTVNGLVQAKTVHLDRTGKVIGDITHEILTIEAGAHFEGRAQHLDSVDSGRVTKLARA